MKCTAYKDDWEFVETVDMAESDKCEYCGRPVGEDREIRTRRGKRHMYCSEFCFRLHFYDVSPISYDDLQNMYRLRCISLKLD